MVFYQLNSLAGRKLALLTTKVKSVRPRVIKINVVCGIIIAIPPQHAWGLGIVDAIEGKIVHYFSGNSQISAVYLFCSAAKNLMRPKSDIDIAVLFETKFKNKIKRFDLILKTNMELEGIIENWLTSSPV